MKRLDGQHHKNKIYFTREDRLARNRQLDREYYARQKMDPNHSRRIREHHLWQEYKLTLEEYAHMRHLVQDNKCDRCFNILTDCKTAGVKESTACVDHCHKTGKVRAILCHKCNVRLGVIESSLQRTLDDILYIKRLNKENKDEN